MRRDRQHQIAPLFAIAASVAALSGALASQYLGGLQPCILCLYQRWPYVAAIALGLLALGLRRRNRMFPLVLALTALALFVTAAIAAFHVGVERQWWAGTDACGGGPDLDLSFEAFKEQLLAAPLVACDRVAWSLFGISMAGYNFLYATACGLVMVQAARQAARRR
jgi:disulfide bond formation protein DsbB